MSFKSPVRRSTLPFKYSLLSRITMSSYNKLAKQRMLSSIELCTNDLTIIKRTKPIVLSFLFSTNTILTKKTSQTIYTYLSSVLSKLTERVKNCLTSHLSTNNLLNSYQYAYTKHHSTESTLLAVHDHIIKSMSEQKVTALCLLDLSAAFDSIDHSILLHRLPTWFVWFWWHSYFLA